jgi:hypothetical protein
MNKNTKLVVGILASIPILSICLCMGGCIALQIEGKVLEKTIVDDPTAAANREKKIIEYGLPHCSQLSQFEGIKVICQVDRVYCSYETFSTDYATFCTDAPSPNEKFTLIIGNEDWRHLEGNCVVIKGTLTMFAGKPQIAFHPSQVDVSPCEP